MSESIVPQRQELTAEYLREILHYDHETGTFTWKVSTSRRVKAGEAAGCPNGHGYQQIKVQNRRYLAHRLAWLHYYGEWPKLDIDHINRNKADNRITNLRDVTHRQNHQNKGTQSNNTSGYPGVTWSKRESKWRANITHNQKKIHLGYFENLVDAVAARKAAEKFYWADTQAQ